MDYFLAKVGPTKESEETRDAVSNELSKILEEGYGESLTFRLLRILEFVFNHKVLIEFGNLTYTNGALTL